MPLTLATIHFESPLFWAVMIGWILTVVLHEFAHGLVGFLGGDYTIKERGGLTLNPFQYIDPVMSIALPLVFLALGGLPLPGASTYVRRDLLRSKAWESAMCLAGPAMNFLIFVLMLGLMHSSIGWFDLQKPVNEWSDAQVVFATVALLQSAAIVLNLIPWPPVDGFNAIAPFLPPVIVERVRTPPLNFILMIAFFSVISSLPVLNNLIYRLVGAVLSLFHIPEIAYHRMFEAYDLIFR